MAEGQLVPGAASACQPNSSCLPIHLWLLGLVWRTQAVLALWNRSFCITGTPFGMRIALSQQAEQRRHFKDSVPLGGWLGHWYRFRIVVRLQIASI